MTPYKSKHEIQAWTYPAFVHLMVEPASGATEDDLINYCTEMFGPRDKSRSGDWRWVYSTFSVYLSDPTDLVLIKLRFTVYSPQDLDDADAAISSERA